MRRRFWWRGGRVLFPEKARQYDGVLYGVLKNECWFMVVWRRIRCMVYTASIKMEMHPPQLKRRRSSLEEMADVMSIS